MPIPLWAAATASALALCAGVGIGDAVISTPTPWTAPAPVTTPLPGTPTGPPITPMHLGDTLLLGDKTGIAFTVTQDADPIVAAQSTPSPGYRYLAVKLTIANTTGSIWHGDGVPNVGSVVITSDGKQYDSVSATTALAPSFGVYLSIAPGGSATGAVTFQVPATAAVTDVQIALTSDDAVIGLWAIR